MQHRTESVVGWPIKRTFHRHTDVIGKTFVDELTLVQKKIDNFCQLYRSNKFNELHSYGQTSELTNLPDKTRVATRNEIAAHQSKSFCYSRCRTASSLLLSSYVEATSPAATASVASARNNPRQQKRNLRSGRLLIHMYKITLYGQIVNVGTHDGHHASNSYPGNLFFTKQV